MDCSGTTRDLSLAMSADALTGFLAWLESAPPSAYLDVARRQASRVPPGFQRISLARVRDPAQDEQQV